MKIILVRHGESTANVNNSVYFHTPDALVPLSPGGEVQALKAGEELAKLIDSRATLYTSPYKRTRQTTELIQQTCNFTVKEDLLLREQEWPAFKTAREREIFLFRRKNSGAEFFFKENGSESWSDVALRAELFLTKLRAAHNPEDTVVIISHQVTIRMLLMLLDNTPYDAEHRDVGNCEIIFNRL